jgi:hypothetical protein
VNLSSSGEIFPFRGWPHRTRKPYATSVLLRISVQHDPVLAVPFGSIQSRIRLPHQILKSQRRFPARGHTNTYGHYAAIRQLMLRQFDSHSFSNFASFIDISQWQDHRKLLTAVARSNI